VPFELIGLKLGSIWH